MSPVRPGPRRLRLPTLAAVVRRTAGTGDLFSPAARDRLEGCTGDLPAALTRRFYLETRLGADERVDLSLEVDAAGREILAGANPVQELPAALRSIPAWAGIGELCRRWMAERPGLAGLGRLWLELDLGAGSSPPAPRSFVDLRDALPLPDGVTAVASLASEVAAVLAGGGRTEASPHVLPRLLTRLPAGTVVYSLGFEATTPARSGASLRLCLRHMDPERLAVALRGCGWLGPADAVARWTRAVMTNSATGGALQLLHLDLDLALEGGVGSRLGLEQTLTREDVAIPLLSRLVDCGLATAERSRALAAWPAREVTTLPHELCPSLVIQRVNHVKVVWEGERATGAKVYLLREHRPFPRAARQQAATSAGPGPGCRRR